VNGPEVEIELEIEALERLSTALLRQRWRDRFGTEPPKISPSLLRLALAYDIQERLLGGLTPPMKRELRRIAELSRRRRPRAMQLHEMEKPGVAKGEPPRRRPHPLSSGTWLLREWNGMIEIVDVLPNGFGWRGRTFRSLSAVAFAITGTNWSGMKFFGLEEHRRHHQPTPAGPRSLE